VLPAAAAEARGRVEPVPGLVERAESIVAGPDGAMWASIAANPGRIARISTAGAVVYAAAGGFGGLPVNRHPSGLAAHDGALWFELTGGPQTFARLRLGYPVTTFSLAQGRPTSLAGGPDGALWMTVEPDAITRLATAPASFATGADPHSIVAGADGALWFIEQGRVGRITTGGAVTYRSVGATPNALAAASDAVWFAQGSTVRRVDDATGYATGAAVEALAAGPDGAMWAAVPGGVVRIVPGETPTTIDVDPTARPLGLAAGPDGRMWMTLDRAPYLVTITVPPLVTDPSEADGWLSARVNTNGLEAQARAEVRQADGSWLAVATTELYGTPSTSTVRLRLESARPGDVVRITVISDAGSASSRGITVAAPDEPDPQPTATATAIPTTSPVPTSAPPAATATPASAPPPAGPVQGRSIEVVVLSGSVSYRLPHANRYSALVGTAVLPLGVTLDTTRGNVRVTSQVRGKPQAAAFHDGKFSVTQTLTGMTEMALAGPLDCSATARANVSAKAKKKKTRTLWGKDSGGSFRTRGNGSVATVRGTEWLTEDTCAGTTIAVRKGAVSVWPRRGGRSKLVQAGQRLFSPRPR
jgi:streptogramin lyase